MSRDSVLGKTKGHIRKHLLRLHRSYIYGQEMEKLLKGETTPEAVNNRWQKLQEVSK